MKRIYNIKIDGSLNIGKEDALYENLDEIMKDYPNLSPAEQWNAKVLDQPQVEYVKGFVKASHFTEENPKFIYVDGKDDYREMMDVEGDIFDKSYKVLQSAVELWGSTVKPGYVPVVAMNSLNQLLDEKGLEITYKKFGKKI